MEQRSFREYLPGKKTDRTKTRGPVSTNHPKWAHNNSTTIGAKFQKENGRNIHAGRNSLETKITGSMAQKGR